MHPNPIHESFWLRTRRIYMGLLANLTLAACAQQGTPSISRTAEPPATTVLATIAVTPVLTPTPFANTSRNCLHDLKITSPDLDQPDGLVLRIVQLQGTGLSTQQRISDVTVSSRGMVRDATWLFFSEIPGLIATLNGRFEPETCSTWTNPIVVN